MNLLIFIRNLADLCLYFGFALAFPKFFHGEITPLIVCFVFSGAILVANLISDRGNFGLRFIALLIPAAYMVLACRSMNDVILCIPPAVYVLLYVIKNDAYLDYYDFLPVYKRLIVAAGMLLLFMLLVEDAFNRTESLNGFVHALPLGQYGVIYALLGMLLLKRLRLGRDFEKQSLVIQIKELLIPLLITGVAALAFFGAEPLGQAIKGFFILILTPAMFILSLIGNVSLDEMQAFIARREESDNSPGIEYQGFARVSTTPAAEVAADAPVASKSWIFALILMMALVGIMVLFVLAVKKRKPAVRRVYSTEKLTDDEEKTAHSLKLSNRDKVRKAYRRYLEKTKAKGVAVSRFMTSSEIGLAAAGVTADRPAAEELRGIYIKARYSPDAEISNEDVRTANRLVKNIFEAGQ